MKKNSSTLFCLLNPRKGQEITLYIGLELDAQTGLATWADRTLPASDSPTHRSRSLTWKPVRVNGRFEKDNIFSLGTGKWNRWALCGNRKSLVVVVVVVVVVVIDVALAVVNFNSALGLIVEVSWLTSLLLLFFFLLFLLNFTFTSTPAPPSFVPDLHLLFTPPPPPLAPLLLPFLTRIPSAPPHAPLLSPFSNL